MTEKQIGKPFAFQQNNKKSVVLLGWPAGYTKNACDGCYFQNFLKLECRGYEHILGPCDAFDRTDHKNIIFKELKYGPFAAIKEFLLQKANEWVKLHPKSGKIWQGLWIVGREFFPVEMHTIQQTEHSLSKVRDNLALFWQDFETLISKKMKPITVKDFKEYLQSLPDNYEILFSSEGEPLRFLDAETDHKDQQVVLTFE